MGLVRMGVPTELVTKLATDLKIVNFIETGTFYGNTAVWASEHFSNVFTIEYSHRIYEEAVRKFNHLSNVKFIFGDSRAELVKLVEKLESPSIFWLDAHWSGKDTYGENDECPLLEEISILNSSKHDDIILIDDARLFTSPPHSYHDLEQWTNITIVINALHQYRNERYIVIIEDVIIAVPNSAKAIVAYYCQEVNAEIWKKYQETLTKPVNLKSKAISEMKKRLRLILGCFTS